MTSIPTQIKVKLNGQVKRMTLPCYISGEKSKSDVDQSGFSSFVLGVHWLQEDFASLVEEQGVIYLCLKGDLSLYGIEVNILRSAKRSTVFGEQKSELIIGDHIHFHQIAVDGILSEFDFEILSVEITDSDQDILAERSIEAVQKYDQQLKTQPEKLNLLYQQNLALSHSKSLTAVFKQTADSIFKLLSKASHCIISLREKDLFSVVFSQAKGEEPQFDHPLQMSRTLIRKVLEKRSALLLMNASEEFKQIESVIQAGLASTICVPLWIEEEIQGVIQIDHRNTSGLFNAQDLELLLLFSNAISAAVYHQSLIQKLIYQEQRLKTELQYLQTKAQKQYGFIGQDEKVLKMLKSIDKVKDLKVPVLIQGETGTGKELIARALHEQSNRREHLFIAQNCGALPESLLESELFGHMKGSFTGADRDKKGLFELAHEGTIFLDEIGEMPLSLQAKLLRVLQEGEIWPVGAGKPKKVDIRIVSATHRDLVKMVQQGAFRQDLYYRLNVYPIKVPPLRERKEDIVHIATTFLVQYNREFGTSIQNFSPLAIKAMSIYHWPGNVRELQNEVQRSIIQCMDGTSIHLDDLSLHFTDLIQSETDLSVVDSRTMKSSTPTNAQSNSIINSRDIVSSTLSDTLSDTISSTISSTLSDVSVVSDSSKMLYLSLDVDLPLRQNIDEVEKQIILKALSLHQNSKTKTAVVLDITREGLYKKLTKLGIDLSKSGEEV